MKHLKILGATATVLASFYASADFRVEGSDERPATTAAISPVAPPAQPAQPAPPVRPSVQAAPAADYHNVFSSTRRSSLTQIGAPAAPPTTVQGFGREVTVVAAVSQVLPSGWRPMSSGAVDPKRIVSWKGSGRTWLAVLDDIAEQAGLMAQVDWVRQEVTFYPAAESVAANANGGASGNGNAAPAKKTTWDLRAGKSLQENLEAWARDAGWKLVWRPDFKFMIAADATLQGEFEGEDGVVARVLGAYRNSKSPIIPEFFLANRVVEIRELSHSHR